MPVFQIRALPQKPGIDCQKVLKRICVETAKVMGLDPSHVWGTWEELKPGLYVEGDKAAQAQMPSSHPPLVNFIAFEGRPVEIIEKALSTTAEILCTDLGLESGNAFITFTEATSGRVYTGGEVRKTKK